MQEVMGWNEKVREMTISQVFDKVFQKLPEAGDQLTVCPLAVISPFSASVEQGGLCMIGAEVGHFIGFGVILFELLKKILQKLQTLLPVEVDKS